MELIPNGIAREIRAELGRQSMTMADLAARTGLSYSTVVRKISNEERELTTGEFARIANVLGVLPSELFERAEQQAVA
ncbi:helix-turn-helix transcriptional regulator [Trueperella pyogenes]|uniref:helix-turn-helix domain-containing protein n=1 Tax=Trueperella pyogenes TaxID=1661 RepID=UPI00143316B6|nr:helix-turn-helix transcriptional regulator [Trueperella pyogenes]QIU87098.1 helix-turn-helix transcriptional regulator [Trueperella pyogenes]